MKSRRETVRVYADTSVFGGVFDEEFEKPSRMLFELITSGRLALVTSELVRQEIQAGPQKVQKLFESMLVFAEITDIGPQVLELQKAYIDEGIVSEKFATDALHMALATLSQVKMIVSWNFKHIVNFRKIPLYNAVNTLNGYNVIAVYSPLEVVEYED